MLLGSTATTITSPTPLTLTLLATGDSTWDTLGRSSDENNCGVTSTHQVACWGVNGYGVVGVGSLTGGPALGPTLVASPVPLQDVAMGQYLACALDDTGAAYCWGVSTSGSLGLGTAVATPCPATSPQTCYPTPTKVVGNIQFASLTASSDHICGIALTGDAYCWGTEPTLVPGGLHFTALSASDEYTCGVTTDAQVWCWGSNLYGQLGFTSPGYRSSSPIRIVPVVVK